MNNLEINKIANEIKLYVIEHQIEIMTGIAAYLLLYVVIYAILSPNKRSIMTRYWFYPFFKLVEAIKPIRKEWQESKGLATLKERVRESRESDKPSHSEKDIYEYTRFIKYRHKLIIKAAPSVGIDNIRRCLDDISNFWCGGKSLSNLKHLYFNRYSIEIDTLPDRVVLDSIKNKPYCAYIGKDNNEKDIYADFKSNGPNLFAVGATGGGKTTAVKTIIETLSNNLESNNLNIVVFDPKDNQDYIRYDTETENIRILERMRKYKALYDEKKALLKDNNAIDCYKYIEKGGKWDFNLIVMDECLDYLNSTGHKGEDKAIIDEIITLTSEICRKGRNVGIYTIFIAQDGTTSGIPPIITKNTMLRLVFYVGTTSNSNSLIGISDAGEQKNFNNVGRAYFSSSKGVRRVQCAILRQN